MQSYAEGDLPIPSPFAFGMREPKFVQLEHFMDACVIYNALEKNRKECMVRCEGHTLDLYSNNEEWLKDLIKLVNTTEFHQPDEDTISFLLDNVDVVITDKPVVWPYKVYLKKFADPNFALYCENNKNIKIGNVALEQIKKQGWLQGFYFWTKTENQLMLAKIALGGGICRVIKYVSKDDLHK